MHAEDLAVVVQVVEHMRVLIAPQPFVFPVEAEGLGLLQHLANLVLVFETTAVGILALIRINVQIVDLLALHLLKKQLAIGVDFDGDGSLSELLLALALTLSGYIGNVGRHETGIVVGLLLDDQIRSCKYYWLYHIINRWNSYLLNSLRRQLVLFPTVIVERARARFFS